MTAGDARTSVNDAARVGDRGALVATAVALPATQAFAYERHRARAYALAVDGARESAIAELNLAAASAPPAAATLAMDIAQLHLLLGDPARALTSLAVVVQSEVPLGAYGRELLVEAVRSAPWEWRRGAQLALAAGHPVAAFAAAGGAIDALGDRTTFRTALAVSAIAVAIAALVALPGLLFDDGAGRLAVALPDRSSGPGTVVVPDRPQPRPRRAAPAAPEAQAPRAAEPEARLIRTTPARAAAPAGASRPTPRAVRPVRPAAPAPAPVPAPPPPPEPEPTRTPAAVVAAPQPAPAPSVAPPPAPAPADHGKGKAKGKDKPKAPPPGKEKHTAVPTAAPASAPAPEAPTAVAAPAGEASTAPGPPDVPPGQAKEKDKEKKK